MRYALLVLIVACSSGGSQPAAQAPPIPSSIDATPVVMVDAPAQQEAQPPAVSPPDAAVAQAPPPKPPKPGPECTASSDCVIHCSTAKGCCSSACGCRTAIPAARVAAADAEFARTCEKATRCPIEDCKYIETHAACENGRCVAKAGFGVDL
ncbi:MAG TPA: hypothetical protein VL463_07940 [Kofleriaceae bacterium]|nr:hypothetical protein [Kofleriaceae bacterium]